MKTGLFLARLSAVRLVKALPHGVLPNVTRRHIRRKVIPAMSPHSWCPCVITDFSDISVWQYYQTHIIGEEGQSQRSNDLPLITGLISGRGTGIWNQVSDCKAQAP